MSYVHHTILLVDSDQDMAHFAMLALQRVGVITPVQLAGTAEEAVDYLKGCGEFQDRENFPLPVLLLLDLKLPGMSGLEFLSWLRLEPVLNRAPVIVLTQPGTESEIERAYELGCNSFLVKPASFNTLLVMMQALVQYWLGLNVSPQLASPNYASPSKGAVEVGAGTAEPGA
uniref:Response regulator receiver protein n=1 Tax=Geobacter sp. (strain M21) TaxID=443144 RepID=C6E959_GEOSM